MAKGASSSSCSFPTSPAHLLSLQHPGMIRRKQPRWDLQPEASSDSLLASSSAPSPSFGKSRSRAEEGQGTTTTRAGATPCVVKD